MQPGIVPPPLKAARAEVDDPPTWALVRSAGNVPACQVRPHDFVVVGIASAEQRARFLFGQDEPGPDWDRALKAVVSIRRQPLGAPGTSD